MAAEISREKALELLKEYNKEPFHIQHALTVEGVMRYMALDQGYNDEKDFWAQVGLLHDIDFERWPEQHCQKAPKLLKEVGFSDGFIHAVQSHAYNSCSDIAPEHQMEKVLYAVDELTGLIGAAALMRLSKSVKDMDTKSIRKKFKSRAFAAGCSRDVIIAGAELLGWELDELFAKTLSAMAADEERVRDELLAHTGESNA